MVGNAKSNEEKERASCNALNVKKNGELE